MCCVKRPLYDLWTPKLSRSLHGKSVSLHLHRIGRNKATSPSAVPQGKKRESKAIKPGRGGDGSANAPSSIKDVGGMVGGDIRGANAGASQPLRNGRADKHSKHREPSTQVSLNDTPHSATPTNSPDEAAIQLSFTADVAEQLHLQDNNRAQITIPLTATMHDLRSHIRHSAARILQESLQASSIFTGFNEISLIPAVSINGHESQLASEDGTSPIDRFSTVSDFFVDPTTADFPLVVILSLIWGKPEPSHSPKKRKTTKGSVVPINFEEIVRDVNNEVDKVKFLGIGETEKRQCARADDIQVEFPLIAEVNGAAKAVKLWRTDGWNFGDDCIGGFAILKQSVDFDEKFMWWGDYAGVQSLQSLQSRIHRPTGGDSRYPFVPSMTCNTFDPSAFSPPFGKIKIAPDRGIAVAVRFVCHLTMTEASTLDFHNNFQISCDSEDDVDSITKEVEKSLQKTASALYEKLRGNWSLALWVLPHKPAPQKMYRFTTGPLMQFVSQQMVDQLHRKLYVEVHLYDRDEKEQPPGLRRSGRMSAVTGTSSDDPSTLPEKNERGAMNGRSRAKGSRTEAKKPSQAAEEPEADLSGEIDGDDYSDEDEEAQLQRVLELSRRERDREILRQAMEQSAAEHDPDLSQAVAESEQDEFMRTAEQNVGAHIARPPPSPTVEDGEKEDASKEILDERKGQESGDDANVVGEEAERRIESNKIVRQYLQIGKRKGKKGKK